MIIIFRIMQITTLYFTLCYQRCYWIYSYNVQSVTKYKKRLNRKSNIIKKVVEKKQTQ